MSDAPQDTGLIDWSRRFAFVHLFRTFRLARQPSKVLLAFLGICLTYGAGRILDAAWSDRSSPALSADGNTSELDYFVTSGGKRTATLEWIDSVGDPERVLRTGTFRLLLDHARTTANLTVAAVTHADPGGIVAALTTGILGVTWLYSLHPLYAMVFTVVGLAIWAVFGGALARAAALHATRDERIGLGEALAFARGKFASFLAAPLLPVIGAALLGFFLWLGGLIGLIPAVGELFVGVFFFLALCIGFALAFVFIGGIAGFALTFPTVAVEGSDAFDAFSRSFSYIYARPWRTAFYALASIAYGALCVAFVKLFARIALWSVQLMVGLSMNWGSPYVADEGGAAQPPKLHSMWQGPNLTGESTFFGGFDSGVELAHVSWFAQFLIKCWIYAVWAVVAAFAVSMFFSASTLMYLLLRREVDATDLEDVYVEVPPEEGTHSEGASPDAGPKPSGGTSLPVVG